MLLVPVNVRRAKIVVILMYTGQCESGRYDCNLASNIRVIFARLEILECRLAQVPDCCVECYTLVWIAARLIISGGQESRGLMLIEETKTS